jgi:DNA-binding CsgD family transcriptional regulator
VFCAPELASALDSLFYNKSTFFPYRPVRKARMALDEARLLRLAASAYEAAVAPELWPAFLKGWTQSVSADCALLQVHDFRQSQSTILISFGMNPRLRESYTDYYSKINVWRNQGYARRKYAAGKTNIDEELCPRAYLECSEFYNDCLAPMDAVHSMGSVLALQDGRAPTLTVLRGKRKTGFDEDERRVADFLLPFLVRAWSVYQRLDVLSAGEQVLDSLPYGVIFVSANESVVHCNRAARHLLREQDGILLRGGILHAADPLSEVSLRHVMAMALSAGRPPAATPVRRPSCRRAYQVTAAPLRNGLPQFRGMAAPAAVVFIFDPDSIRTPQPDLLIQLYGLTPKEALITQKLAEGKSVEQAAQELQIRYETARTHLRRIFSKTQTSRQTELLLLLARLPLGGS